MIKYLFAILTVIAISLNAQNFADRSTQVIKGVVIDSSSNSGLPFANITLHNSSDSTFVNGASTGTDGEFILYNIPTGDFYLKISFIGYNTKYVPGVKITNAKATTDVGTILLSKTTYELSGAEVVGEKVSEELHLDKKVINVSQNLNVQGGTALDVLQSLEKLKNKIV